jgi:hypothetical protein
MFLDISSAGNGISVCRSKLIFYIFGIEYQAENCEKENRDHSGGFVCCAAGCGCPVNTERQAAGGC